MYIVQRYLINKTNIKYMDNLENSFLPKGYEAPKTEGGYFKFEQGQNKFLILSSAITGWEYWNTLNKPIRVKTAPESIPSDIRLDKEGLPTKTKHFWAFAVWNFKTEKVEVLQITQSSIRSSIQSILENEEWGSPVLTYALNVGRTGEGLDTEYTVTPSPKKVIDKEITDEWSRLQEAGFDLQELFAGGNPFSPNKIIDLETKEPKTA